MTLRNKALEISYIAYIVQFFKRLPARTYSTTTYEAKIIKKYAFPRFLNWQEQYVVLQIAH
jgi:hypothetical protein